MPILTSTTHRRCLGIGCAWREKSWDLASVKTGGVAPMAVHSAHRQYFFVEEGLSVPTIGS